MIAATVQLPKLCIFQKRINRVHGGNHQTGLAIQKAAFEQVKPHECKHGAAGGGKRRGALYALPLRRPSKRILLHFRQMLRQIVISEMQHVALQFDNARTLRHPHGFVHQIVAVLRAGNRIAAHDAVGIPAAVADFAPVGHAQAVDGKNGFAVGFVGGKLPADILARGFGKPFVRVQPQHPRRADKGVRTVALRAEARPIVKNMHVGAILAGDFYRVIATAGVDNHDVAAQILHAVEALRQHALFVFGNQDNGQQGMQGRHGLL